MRPRSGWQRLFEPADVAPGPIAAYSEFMPPPRVGPAGDGPGPFAEDDPWGWRVTEREEVEELRPGLDHVAREVVGTLARLSRGDPAHGLARSKLAENPYYPPELAARGGDRAQDRLVCILPLALSKSQDDKGRVRWTLFGGSEQGPARPFWRSFFDGPDVERPAADGLDFLARLLAAAFGTPIDRPADLRRAGLRVLPQGELPEPLPNRPEGPLPSWVEPLLLWEGRSLRGVRFLLTFRPFAALPPAVRRAYLAGDLHLLPSPAALLFWGERHYLELRKQLPLAMQVPLLNLVARRDDEGGLRVPQSGWLHEPSPEHPEPSRHHGPIVGSYVRTHRNVRTRRDEPSEPLVTAREDKVARVLFGTAERDLGLYGKPMARNAQLWAADGRLLLDGPRAGRDAIARAAEAVAAGGTFGYRFQFPAVRAGRFEVYWHRPLVAFFDSQANTPTVLHDAPLGYLTAYRADGPDPSAAVELWPRPLRREAESAAVAIAHRSRRLGLDCHNLLSARDVLAAPLPRSFAIRLVAEPDPKGMNHWIDNLARHAGDTRLAEELRAALSREDAGPTGALTLERTSRRAFEVCLWRTIAAIAGGRFPNRNVADCARDPATRKAVSHPRRDLGRLGDHLLKRHLRAVAASGMGGRAVVGDLPFHWRTDFDLDWSDGWLRSQGIEPRDRDLMVVIPGRDRSRAVIMADHYDTAYMEDRYRRDGARVAARGADDNTSATAALLLAAPVLLDLAREDRLGCDVWLVHLTGEEFPADCLGARHLSDLIRSRSPTVRLLDGGRLDLSKTRVAGLYVLDMVAHENRARPGVFQIAPGVGREAMRLALEAHRAAESWNSLAPGWDRHPSRRHRRPRRGGPIPSTARHPHMIGEVRPHDDPRSTLYNTDGQVFSDAGIPSVLFMEDYDINRKGYHDSRDTMAGIDLAYGAALVAIAIEAVARATWLGAS
ncbi:MAG TPA: M28 family peptidase [Isosphaeraceae bacterium]|jgi:hypothetical protein|nr:M28 family peptidase [Isosphaeraceae bacterium]